jgi:hypothetical protein
VGEIISELADGCFDVASDPVGHVVTGKLRRNVHLDVPLLEGLHGGSVLVRTERAVRLPRAATKDTINSTCETVEHSRMRTMAKRNLTVQLDEDVIQQAKVLAARRGTSVSTMVAAELERLVADDDRYEDAFRRAQRALAGATPRGGRRWSRDDLYDR